MDENYRQIIRRTIYKITKMCLYSKIIANPKYKPNKKNGGVIPSVPDYRVMGVPIGCGKCIECMKQKARGWQQRLTEEIKRYPKCQFYVMTLSNESYKELYSKAPDLPPYDKENFIITLALRYFTERYRKHNKIALRHWAVPELGGGRYEHIHLNILIWSALRKEIMDKYWKYGFTYRGDYVNARTINYITKYITKTDQKHKYYKPVILTSNGIGQAYTNSLQARAHKYKDTNTDEGYRLESGHKLNLNTYWRNKLYTDEQKEKLWINKLDKKERWICGERIDLSKSGAEEEYYTLLEWHRERNKLLGYGDNSVNWNRKQYEESRRLYLQEARITAPSAGSLAKGIGYYKRPSTTQETGNLKGWNIQSLRSRGVAPAVGCQRITDLIEKHEIHKKTEWDVENKIWKIKKQVLT
jgi:hypothetical protein